jgi:DNA-binding NarL/FixJ family response regulator
MRELTSPVAASTDGCPSCDLGTLCYDPTAAERARVSRDAAQSAPTRVVLCSDHPIMRSALHLLVETRSGQYEVALESAICPNAFRLLNGADIDVLLLEFDLDENSAHRLFALQALLTAAPSLPVLILTVEPDADACYAAFQMGVRGIVLKNKKLDDLFTALDRIRRGDTWLEGAALNKLLGRSVQEKKVRAEDSHIALLTRREREIVGVVAAGRTNREVSQELFISDVTVRHHLCAIFDKLRVSSRGELIVYAYRNGLADLSSLDSN